MSVTYDEKDKTDLFTFENEERFLLRSKGEIARVLKDLAKKPEIVTAYIGTGERSLLTAILAVLPDRNLLVLDSSADSAINRQVVETDQVICVAHHDQVKIKFTLHGLKLAKFQDEPVFAAPFPETLFRPQRREFFRMKLTRFNPLQVQIPHSGDGEPLKLTIVDLSYGGIGVQVDDGQLPAVEIGEVLPQCRLDLPGFGTVTVDLEVRGVMALQQRDGTEQRRIGFRFIGLGMDDNALISRFLHKLQVDNKQLG